MYKALVVLVCLVGAFAFPCAARSTIIFWDGRALWSDSQMTRGTTSYTGWTKLRRVNGFVIGACGSTDDIDRFVRWFEEPSQPRPKITGSMSALVANKYGCWQYDESCVPHYIKSAPYAIGSGHTAAIAACKAGADARRAIEIAEEMDNYCGGEIERMSPW